MAQDVFRTPAGWVGIAASAQGVRRLTLPCPSEEAALAELGPDPSGVWTSDSAGVGGLAVRIERYFGGEPVDFSDVSLDLTGRTGFQRSVLEAVRAIPRGAVRSYGQVAVSVGRPGAARAVGAVMARNPICIVIPCHRVIGADGSLVGFGGGIGMKRHMLDMEAAGLTMPHPGESDGHPTLPAPRA